MMVLDCSTAIAWALDEDDGERAAGVIDRLEDGAAIVPAIWPAEVANALIRAERKGRLVAELTGDAVAMIEELPVTVDDEVAVVLREVLDLARSTGLTAYDASYLELAGRLGLPLATLDRRLAAAAEACGVAVL